MIQPAGSFDSEVQGPARPDRREQFFEVVVFLLLILPAILLTPFTSMEQTASFKLLATATILRDVALTSLVAFFLWRNREAYAHVGWTSRGLWKEVALGCVLFVPAYLGAGLVALLARTIGLDGPRRPPAFMLPHSADEIAMAVLLVIVVAVAEETIFRGYLLLRFRTVLGSLPAAVVLSTVIFSVGHSYQGQAGVVTVGFLGLAFCLVYIWRRSLVAPGVMHFLQDFINIVIVSRFLDGRL